MATPAPEDEITTNFFGINPKTYEVESFSLTRGGTLRAQDGTDRVSSNISVTAAKHQLAARLGLVEIVEASAQHTGDEQRRRIIEDLETKAEVMKQENSE